MKKKSPKLLIAYCWADGRIEFGNQLPQGGLTIVSGYRRKAIRSAVRVLARWSYPTKPGVRGANGEVPLVPGIPEAENEMQRIDALSRFIKEVQKQLEPKKYGK